MEETLRLFKAVPIAVKKQKKIDKELLAKTVKYGYILSPEVVFNYPDPSKIITEANKIFGLTATQMNSSFHKSWAKIKDASLEQLFLEQIMHYITTYGFETLGVFDHNTVYIPKEKLQVPMFEGISLIVINGYTKEELKDKLMTMLGSGVALGKESVDDIVEVASFVKISEKEVEDIKNKEVKAKLYEKFGIVPANPIEFLRYAVTITAGSPLLIKSPAAIAKIKEVSGKEMKVADMFGKYRDKYGLTGLSGIFYRYKPIFLAFRANKNLRPLINRVRRLAKTNHKPMQKDYLNEVTATISKTGKINSVELTKELEKVNVFRKIRLAYALKFRTRDVDSILYKIRNGKAYAEEFSFKNKDAAKKALDIVLDSIKEDIKKNVKGKKIFIPEFIKYTLPATEKQFSGFYPCGTCVTVPKDMVFGVAWKNTGGHRIDLDLSLMNASVGKIGWDGLYRRGDSSILFSGDMTDAPLPNGASELFYVKRQLKDSFLMNVNYFNYDEKTPVPIKIIVAKEQVMNLHQNYMVNPNNVVAVANSFVEKKQKILGVIVTTTDECRFYFAEASIGDSITASLGKKYNENSRKYLFEFYSDMITLNDVLVKSGAVLVTDKKDCDIDLSPDGLEKDTILSLIQSK